jgi:hypothetical protein
MRWDGVFFFVVPAGKFNVMLGYLLTQDVFDEVPDQRVKWVRAELNSA